MLRRNAPNPELILWKSLKGKQTGYKFRRQFGIGPYVVDFYCPQLKLVIEIDGESHFTQEAIAYDKERELYITGSDAQILRFTNEEINNNVEGVLTTIQETLNSLSANANTARADLP